MKGRYVLLVIIVIIVVVTLLSMLADKVTGQEQGVRLSREEQIETMVDCLGDSIGTLVYQVWIY